MIFGPIFDPESNNLRRNLQRIVDLLRLADEKHVRIALQNEAGRTPSHTGSPTSAHHRSCWGNFFKCFVHGSTWRSDDLPTLRWDSAPTRASHSVGCACNEVAIAVHAGSHNNIDLVYGALATYVTQHALAVDGPIREYYVVGPQNTPDEIEWRTEIAWPIFQTRHENGP
jgi:hypothetical protein